MTRRLGYVLAPFFFAAILAACNDGTGKNSAIKSIDIIDNNGKKIGTARVSENLMGGVNLVVDASPIPEGEHGIHFHQKADCKTPSFKSAGGHINPQGKAHGLKNPGGPGNGDMPNAIANEWRERVDRTKRERLICRPYKPVRQTIMPATD